MAIDKVVSASITDSSVTSAKVASGVLQPNFRNIVINGDMTVVNVELHLQELRVMVIIQSIDF
jgi:hypothetical protein